MSSRFRSRDDRPMPPVPQSAKRARCYPAQPFIRQPPHEIKFVVRAHRGDVGHPVRQREEGRNRGDVPDVVVGKAMAGDRRKILLGYLLRINAHLHREIEHGALSRRDVGFAVIDGDLVCNQRVLRPDAQDGAMRDHAILALVGARRRHHDHLALGLGEPAVLLHQRIMIGEEGAEFVGPIRQRQEHVRNEAGFLLHREEAGPDILRQAVDRRGGEALCDGLGHGQVPAMRRQMRRSGP